MKNDEFRTWSIDMSKLTCCDVILTNGLEHVGIKYDFDYSDAPFIASKGACIVTAPVRKILETTGIPCVENKPLAGSLFQNYEIGEPISIDYYNVLAKLYSNLVKDSGNTDESDFLERLNKDVFSDVRRLEERIYKKVIRRFEKQEGACAALYEGEAGEYLKNEIRTLTEFYKLNARYSYNPATKNHEFYLETYIQEYDLDFWQVIIVSEKEQNIYVGSRHFIKIFAYNEVDTAIKFLKEMLKACNGALKEAAQAYCEEYNINPRLYEIALNSIKTMLEMNYNKTGLDYVIHSDTTRVGILLKKKYLFEDETMKMIATINGVNIPPKNRMYEIVITYNEFLRNPELFKKFLEDPKPMKKWNFWCKERSYNSKYFDK